MGIAAAAAGSQAGSRSEETALLQGPRLSGRTDAPTSLEGHHGSPPLLGFVSKIRQVLQVESLAARAPPAMPATAAPHGPGKGRLPRSLPAPARDSALVPLWHQVRFCVGSAGR